MIATPFNPRNDILDDDDDDDDEQEDFIASTIKI